jgi:hypothetical protein
LTSSATPCPVVALSGDQLAALIEVISIVE